MKTRHGAPFRNALLSAGLLTVLSACAPTGSPASLKASAVQSFEQFEGGEAALSCRASCANAWDRSQSELFGLYEAGDWQNLALRVLQINHRQDLGYFYLGRAAEGLRRRLAALAYYRAATDLATGPDPTAKCNASGSRCNGLNLLNEALLRIQIVSAPRGSAVQARNAGRNPGSSRPNASTPWVDPPPVTP
jgi:hypothetical protein